jgi:predicted acyltransferase
MSTAKAETGSSDRLVSIDQLRAWAIFGMVIVNAKNVFLDPVRPTLAATPFEEYFGLLLHQLSHHDAGFTHADSIAPLSVFVVGMAVRLSWLKTTARAHDPWAVRRSMAKRFALLVLIAFAI